MDRGQPSRKRPTPMTYTRTPAEAQRVAEFNARRDATPRAGSISTHGTAESGAFQVALEHPDQEVGSVALMESFGVKEGVLGNALLFQIINICRENATDTPDQSTINAAIAAVHGIAPQDEAESLLATQMVGVHFLAMKLLQRSMTASSTVQTEQNVNLVTKMLRTFAAQLEALKRYRSKSEQRVTVTHQHVNVAATQANVQVNASSQGVEGAGGALKLEAQSDDQRQLADAHLAPMWSEDPSRNPMPVPGCAGAEALPPSRRHQPRRAKGQPARMEARQMVGRHHSGAPQVPGDDEDGKRAL